MKIYDVSQEVFGCRVYPGDPAPEKRTLAAIEKGDCYNLTAFSMCAHNGTHIDAPAHFIPSGDTVDALSLSSMVGYATVVEHHGEITASDAADILRRSATDNLEAARRILIKGDATVSEGAARIFAQADLLLLGNESQTVGPEDAPMAVHQILLGAGVLLLEGIRLAAVPMGVYLLCAAPLCLGGADGAPCRALLLDMNDH